MRTRSTVSLSMVRAEARDEARDWLVRLVSGSRGGGSGTERGVVLGVPVLGTVGWPCPSSPLGCPFAQGSDVRCIPGCWSLFQGLVKYLLMLPGSWDAEFDTLVLVLVSLFLALGPLALLSCLRLFALDLAAGVGLLPGVLALPSPPAFRLPPPGVASVGLSAVLVLVSSPTPESLKSLSSEKSTLLLAGTGCGWTPSASADGLAPPSGPRGLC